jgi:hypothetical protein
MKSSISDNTKHLLEAMEIAEKSGISIPFFSSDELEMALFQRGIKIHSIEFVKGMDMFIIILNNKEIIKDVISDYPELSSLTHQQLTDYSLSEDKLSVRWEKEDIDLSLIGFVRKHVYKESERQKVEDSIVSAFIDQYSGLKILHPEEDSTSSKQNSIASILAGIFSASRMESRKPSK